jgi:putative ABC transport system permease protein
MGFPEKSHQPPHWPVRMLRALVKQYMIEEIEGDLFESYYLRLKSKGKMNASLFFVLDAIKYSFWYSLDINKLLKIKLISTMLWLNYLKIALRNIRRHKSYSLVSIFCLSLASAVGLIIFYYSYKLFTMDQFHTNSEDIYLAYRVRPNDETPVPDTWYPMLPELKKEIPEIVDGMRFAPFGNVWISYDGKKFQEQAVYTDASVLTMFDFKLLLGDKNTAMKDPYSLVISREFAKKHFGETDPVGKTVKINFTQDYTIRGVLDEIPANSSFTFNMIMPLYDQLPYVKDAGWQNSFLYTFIKVRKGTDLQAMAKKFPAFTKKYFISAEKGQIRLTNLRDYNVFINGENKYGFILILVSIGILLIACINFTNLATAQYTVRAKEIGIRKVLGSSGSGLIKQFLTESILISVFAVISGLFLSYLLMPVFAEFISMPLKLDILAEPILIPAILTFALGLGIVAGCYPAFYLSRLKPATVLKSGSGRNSGIFSLRSGLVVSQFVVAICLVSLIQVMNGQVEFMKNKKLNFDKDNVLIIQVSPRDFEDREMAPKKIQAFANEISNIPGVDKIALSNSVPGNYSGSFTLLKDPLSSGKEILDWRYVFVDEQFFDTYNIRIKEGRNFQKGALSNAEYKIILNESALKALGWDSAEGKILTSSDGSTKFTVIGLVEDFNYQSVQQAIQPVVHIFVPSDSRGHRYISVRIEPSRVKPVIEGLRNKWKELDESREFSFFFPNETFNNLYQREENMSDLMNAGTAIALIIACLGLYSLSLFITARKTKEIAVRKVMGASVWQIVRMFGFRFSMLIALAFLLSIPVSYFLAEKWLQDFAYRTSPGSTVFIASGIIVILIGLITVSFQTLKAAIANPVNNLRSE